MPRLYLFCYTTVYTTVHSGKHHAGAEVMPACKSGTELSSAPVVTEVTPKTPTAPKGDLKNSLLSSLQGVGGKNRVTSVVPIYGSILSRIKNGLGTLVLATLAWACHQSKEKPAAVANSPQAIPAEIYVVRDTSIREQIRLVGSLVANEEVELVSEQSRRLTKVNFPDGAFVRKGQLLFKLDDADLRSQLKKLAAQRKLSSGEEFRSASLLKVEGISQQEYERVASSIEVLDAEMEAVKVQLAKTEIRAPFSGKTGIRRVSEGAFVQPNTPLVTLEDISRVKVEFAVPEKYANRVRLQQEIDFTVENSDQPFRAKIAVIEPRIDLNTRSLFMQAVADNQNQQLIPGSSATILLDINAIEHTVLIPTQALIPGLESNSVLRVKSGKAQKINVTTGLRTNRNVQIVKGLATGDTIMTTNILRAKPGVPVRVVSATK